MVTKKQCSIKWLYLTQKLLVVSLTRKIKTSISRLMMVMSFYISQFIIIRHIYINYTIDDSEETTVKTFDDTMSGWFKFVQTEDGSVPAVIHQNAEDSDALNFKKSIVAAFQANFKGTSRKVEADPQSIHVAEYT